MCKRPRIGACLARLPEVPPLIKKKTNEYVQNARRNVRLLTNPRETQGPARKECQRLWGSAATIILSPKKNNLFPGKEHAARTLPSCPFSSTHCGLFRNREKVIDRNLKVLNV
jgi:hypothetical protein